MTQPSSSGLTPAPAGGFQRILIGIDFSPASLGALEVVRARFPGAQLRLAHVTDARAVATPDVLGGVTPVLPDAGLLQTLEDADAMRLATLVRDGEDTELLVGDPVTGLLEAAQHWGADLIVVGTHTQGAIEHFFLGSSAEKIVVRSPVPVLCVREGWRA
ncbi:Nucleotide-binding universal stress protein, UspA family [Deinococcus reticulitermitis]|uniref:Nucleotide-binding universal stress protein, UspA family n=1 Tax=Deinococcus reticulitermitis TaxID=856736 RepID=A0A1H7A385_9DEIO|nr:universal stress protein [Deinococcus reticulitermitis]SEJ58367.1 Nucleotide-binding universal stress protein, UspA family [Deinococcus reticulitermitis]